MQGYASDDDIRAVATTFGGVEHRIEFVREKDGVKYYNDSIASSPTRTIAGLNSFQQKVILIAGGYDKHIPYDVLGQPICDHVKLLLLTGATAPKIRECVENIEGEHPPIIEVENLETAVQEAAARAESGDVVIMSPRPARRSTALRISWNAASCLRRLWKSCKVKRINACIISQAVLYCKQRQKSTWRKPPETGTLRGLSIPLRLFQMNACIISQAVLYYIQRYNLSNVRENPGEYQSPGFSIPFSVGGLSRGLMLSLLLSLQPLADVIGNYICRNGTDQRYCRFQRMHLLPVAGNK